TQEMERGGRADGGEREPGLIGVERVEPRPAVQAFVLVVAGGRHPRPEASRARVVVPEAAPGLNAEVLTAGDVPVAQVAVEQMEQGPARFHLADDQTGVRRPGLRGRGAQLVRDALIAEAAEGQRRAPRGAVRKLPATGCDPSCRTW